MKRFIAVACAVVLVLLAGYYAYYHLGIYMDFRPDAPVTTFMKTDQDTIYMERDGEYVPFEIRGVNMGVGLPGKWATDYAIDQDTYLRWFQWIQELGANTLRVYTILHQDFYDAFYDYNTQREAQGLEPLWLLHGVWVDDYVQNSHRDAYDDEFLQAFLEDSRTLVDILHGNRNLSLGYGLGSGSYRRDVSPWVIGYILGVEWEDVTVAYTNEKYPERTSYQGTYLYTTQDATPFEAMLAQVGDNIIAYETTRYKQQRLVAFSNWPTTDPFLYPDAIRFYFMKCAQVDVEHIQATQAFQSGQFASYHVYPYYPDYLNYVLHPVEFEDEPLWAGEPSLELEKPASGVPIEEFLTGNPQTDFYDQKGQTNTYYAYLKLLNEYHTMPVVISEYGVSTGRGMAQKDANTHRNQGHMTEQEQGQAIIDCYEDIMAAGSAGSCVFTWQDEWFKRTWNTMHAVDLDKTAYWSDYQTNEQYFGLLAFDPGTEKSICYVDGDASEWSDEDKVLELDNGSLSMKYDEKFLYFYVTGEGFDPTEDVLYLPIDITPHTGSPFCENYDLTFERDCDFVISIDGADNSRVLVQERYDVLRAMFLREIADEDAFTDPPLKDSPQFKTIELMLQTATPLLTGNWSASAETYETGLLRYGSANPDTENFDSLADFMFTENGVEIRIPWQLLNFSNPSDMMVHQDYYECFGVESFQIQELYVGFSWEPEKDSPIPMASLTLKGWGKNVTYHERLKESYYILQDYWTSLQP